MTAGLAMVRRKRWFARFDIWLTATIFVLLIGLLAAYWPIGYDYLNLHEVAEAWLAGETRLYDAVAPQFYNPPWSMLWFAPLSLLPVPVAQAIHLATSVAAILGAIHIFRREYKTHFLFAFLAFANLHVLHLHVAGNLDGFVLMGIGLGWLGVSQRRAWLLGAGLLLMSLKPINVMPTAILFLIGIRHWSRADQLKSLVPILLAIGVSPLIAGLNWPVLYYERIFADRMTDYFLVVTIWRTAAALHVPVAVTLGFCLLAAAAALAHIRWNGINATSPALILATTMLMTPYASGVHFVLLTPAVLLISTFWPLGIFAFLAALTPLLRLAWGYDITWIDFGYVLTVFVGIWTVLLIGQPRRAAVSSLPKSISPVQTK